MDQAAIGRLRIAVKILNSPDDHNEKITEADLEILKSEYRRLMAWSMVTCGPQSAEAAASDDKPKPSVAGTTARWKLGTSAICCRAWHDRNRAGAR